MGFGKSRCRGEEEVGRFFGLPLVKRTRFPTSISSIPPPLLCSPASASFDPALRMLWPREMKENSEGNGLPRIDLRRYRCSPLLYRWINGELIIDANLIFDPDNWERNERILGWKISFRNSTGVSMGDYWGF